MLESFSLALSYPLRLMATWLAVGALRLFGFAVQTQRTLITLEDGELEIAITDACSGIEQLFALVVIGGFFAFMMQHRLLPRIMHWATVLPCVVLANAIRLVAIVVLYRIFGETILGNAWHMALGWAQTVLAVALLWLVGILIHRLAAH